MEDIKVRRSVEEIDLLCIHAFENREQGETKNGTYEQGIIATLNWLMIKDEKSPLELPEEEAEDTEQWAVVEVDYCSGDLEKVILFSQRHEAEEYVANSDVAEDLKYAVFGICKREYLTK
jgi:hypothetical protein